jgi:hypothetical protein
VTFTLIALISTTTTEAIMTLLLIKTVSLQVNSSVDMDGEVIISGSNAQTQKELFIVKVQHEPIN